MNHEMYHKNQKYKVLEENVGEYPHNLGVVKNFLSRIHTHTHK